MISNIKFEISTNNIKKALEDIKEIEKEQKDRPYNNIHSSVIIRVDDKNTIIRRLFRKK